MSTTTGRRQKLTISLSESTLHLMGELKELTDADTMSEVVRNAIRFHHKHLCENNQ